MAKLVYVNWRTGDDANTGLSAGAAKRTILGARAATAAATASTAASPDTVLIAPGVYFEEVQGTSVFSAAADTNVVYASDGTGEVVVDFENRAPFIDGVVGGTAFYWRFTVAVIFVGVNFRNFYHTLQVDSPSAPTTRSAYALFDARTTGTFGRVINCAFYQRDGAANSGRPIHNFSAENCSFSNLTTGYVASFSSGTQQLYGNYFKNVTTPVSGTAPSARDYNAYPGNTTETNGINTSTANYDPGFRNTANDDLRLDPVTDSVAWGRLLSLGRYGGRIGATGKGGPFYRYDFPQLRMITPVPASAWVAWENDTSYTSTGVLGSITQDATTGELKIDLVAVPTATDARARSDVYDLGAGSSPNLASISIGRQETIASGEALDTNTTLPQKWEYRSSNTAFLKGDGSPAWIEVEDDTYINSPHRYVQFRITFRTNHTNA